MGSLEEREALAQGRRRLSEARESRVHPGRDDKVLTLWNRLLLAAGQPSRYYSPSKARQILAVSGDSRVGFARVLGCKATT